jgi:hypothetical protein
VYQLAFANGGYQNNTSISEALVSMVLGIELIEGLENQKPSFLDRLRRC